MFSTVAMCPMKVNIIKQETKLVHPLIMGIQYPGIRIKEVLFLKLANITREPCPIPYEYSTWLAANLQGVRLHNLFQSGIKIYSMPFHAPSSVAPRIPKKPNKMKGRGAVTYAAFPVLFTPLKIEKYTESQAITKHRKRNPWICPMSSIEPDLLRTSFSK